MENAHIKSASAFEKAPEIEKAAEFHMQEAIQARKISHRLLSISISTVSLGVLGYIAVYFIEKGHCAEKNILVLLSYIIIKAILILVSYDLFTNTLMIVRNVVKNAQPESIFINCLLSMMTHELGLAMSLSFGYWLPSYNEVYERSASIKRTGLFYWLIGIEDRSFANICFERNFIQGLTVVMAIMMLRDGIVFGLNFNVHYKYYVDRINKNSERIDILQTMNNAIGAGYMGDVDIIAQRLVQMISKNGETIARDDLQPFFGETVSEKIIELCSPDNDEGITAEEIRSFYIYTMLEQQKIVKSLEQNSESVQNFKRILDVLFIPTAFLYFINSLKVGGSTPGESHNLGFLSIGNLDSNFLGALLFSTSYSFSDNIKGFLSSLNFIFFVRPYEVEDIVIFQNKAYKVHAINLLTTVFLEESKYTVFPNSFLSTQPITNLRLKKTWDEHFTFDFNFDQFEAKKDDFLAKITEYVKKRSSEFRKKPYFSTITLKEENKANVSLVIGFNLDISDLDVIQERRNRFLFVLNGMLHECNLVPYRK